MCPGVWGQGEMENILPSVQQKDVFSSPGALEIQREGGKHGTEMHGIACLGFIQNKVD